MFSQKYLLTIRDINYGNHLDHLALLNYLHETRVRFLRMYGYTELDVDGLGNALVVADLQCSYRKECFYGDEIEVILSLELVSPTRLVLIYQIFKDQDQLVANANIRLAFINKAERKVVSVPEYLQKLANPEG